MGIVGFMRSQVIKKGDSAKSLIDKLGAEFIQNFEEGSEYKSKLSFFKYLQENNDGSSPVMNPAHRKMISEFFSY